MPLDNLEFRTPIVEMIRDNVTQLLKGGSPGVGLLVHQVWQRRLKSLWSFVSGIRMSAQLNFPNTPAGQSSALLVNIPIQSGSVSIGDFVDVSPGETGVIIPNSFYRGIVTQTTMQGTPGVVTVLFVNTSAAPIDPPQGVFQIRIISQ